MRNRKHNLNKSLWLASISLLVLLLLASCSNIGKREKYEGKGYNKQCAITPELVKALVHYNVENIGDGFLIVSDYHPNDSNDYKYKRYGCMDMSGKIIMPIQYTSLLPVGGELLIAEYVEKAHGLKRALINKKGKEITAYSYDGLVPIGNRANNYFCGKKDGKVGIIDRGGKTVIPFEYDEIYDFYDGYKSYDGFTSKDYNGFRPMKFFRYFSKEKEYDDAFYLIKDGNGIVVNLTLKNNSPNVKHEDTPFDYQRIKRNGKYGFVNCYGEEIPCQYQDAAKLFSDDLAAVVQNDKVGFIDKKGNLVIPFQYDYSTSVLKDTDGPLATLYIFSEGYACVKKGKKYGFIDKQGNTVIPFVYDWPGAFHDGVAVVAKTIGGKELFGLIDKNNSTILPFEFDYGHYQEKVYVMKKNDSKTLSLKDGIYSAQGKCLSPCQYDGSGFALVFNPHGYSIANKNGKFGIVNYKGEELIPCIYDLCAFNLHLSESGVQTMSGTVIVQLNEKMGVLNLQNNVLVPVEFDYLRSSYYDKNLFIVGKQRSRKGLYDTNGNCTLD